MLIAAFIPIIFLYSHWLPLTFKGLIKPRDERYQWDAPIHNDTPNVEIDGSNSPHRSDVINPINNIGKNHTFDGFEL
jgi:hypothetical protein